MTDDEYIVLDELYFVQDFKFLQENCAIEDPKLISTLEKLWERGWIKVLVNVDEEEKTDQVNIKDNHHVYFYLANKKGLMAHNS